MASAYDLLRTKVETLASNPRYQQSASTLLASGLQMSLKELLEMQCSDSAEVNCFRYMNAFLKYLAEAPLGPEYESLEKVYVSSFNFIPNDCKTEVSGFLSSMFLAALSKEVQLDKFSDLNIWFETYEYLKSNNVETQPFENSLSLNFKRNLWNVIGENELDINKCIECSGTIIIAQSKGFILGDSVSIFISRIYGYMNMKFEMYNEGEKYKYEDISRLVYVMKNIKLESDSEKHQIERLEDYFGALAPQIQCDPVKNKPKKMLIRLDTNYQGIDFNNLVFVATVYANVTNPNFNINIHHYSCPVRGDIAIKVYEIKNASYDLNKIKNEVDILETLPGQFALLNGPAQTSCFIKFYGSFWEQGKVYIGMEYIKDTLMAKISEMRTSNISFSEDHMIFYARQLISTHAFMAQLGVYHQDIKPQNILVTANWELRIIDFSVSASKSYDEATLSQTSMHYIQGTQGYMAPELQAHALSGSKSQLKFRPGKADVFSLGLVLLQMYTLKELHTLNMPENHPKLMQLVDNLPFPWFQTLLKSMLQLDYHNRASFKKALNFVPGRATTV